tara:strand:+ start:1590 stop:1760 length:171 start_codon:yes stop_codon:yes gene_type:complete
MKIFLLLISLFLISACSLETFYLKKTITKEKDSVIQDATVIKSASSSSMEGVVSND